MCARLTRAPRENTRGRVKVYLVRASLTVDAPADAARAARHLSLRGRQVARSVGTALARHGDAVDAIYTSPEVAAVQTAELFADRTDHLGEVRVLRGVTAGLAPRAVADAVLAGGASVMVVGEEPWLAAFGAFLVGSPAFPPGRPAQVSLVEDGRPAWALNPETLVFATLTVS